jgi:hypothetical protein
VAETSFPTAGGGSVTDAEYESLMASATGDGLVGSPALAPLVYADSSGRQVKIRASRGAIVRGFRWSSDALGLTQAIAANASGQTRIDTVVLRLDRNTFNVRVAVIQGTPAATPVAPSPLYQGPPAQYFDMPLAQVTVRNGVTILDAADVTETTWYLAEPLLINKSNFTPPSIPGRMIWQYDANALWVADSSGSYDNVQRDSGWLTLGLTSGWSAGSGLKLRRKGDVCFLNISIRRTGSSIAANTDMHIGTVSTASYRPEGLAPEAIYHVSDPGHTANFYISPTNGQIILNNNPTYGVDNNAVVWGSVSYPVSGW